MGDTPWRINEKVLDIVEHFYESGGGLGEIPLVDSGDAFEPAEDLSFLKKWRLEKEKKDNWSLLSDFEIRLGIARSFRRVERFYIPLNLDFRGRIYPISPHISQIGNDLCRGLMEFADGKPLGKGGFRWLKIHLANKMGHDKLPMQQREDIIDEMLPEILKIADDPVTN